MSIAKLVANVTAEVSSKLSNIYIACDLSCFCYVHACKQHQALPMCQVLFSICSLQCK